MVDLMLDLIFSSFSSTLPAFHFQLTHPFELVLFALSSLPCKDHLAQRKLENALGNFIWPWLEIGDLDSTLYRDL